MRQSNGYVVISTMILTIICASLLASVKMVLTPEHKKNEEVDNKSKILAAYEPLIEGTDVLKKYDENIEGIVLNSKGEQVFTDTNGDSLDASRIDILKVFKETDDSKKFYPVFKYRSEVFEGQYGAFIIPMYGNGLWDYISGYIALEPDFNTIKGAVLAHKGETPGLGARITDADVQARFVGKKIYDDAGVLQSVAMVKGEGGASDFGDHKVDGLSGASMTTAGVNDMLANYFGIYETYFKSELEKAKSNTGGSSEEDLHNKM